jgi:hypothetical protein
MRGAEIANGGNLIAPDGNIDMFRFGTGSIVNRAAFDDDVENPRDYPARAFVLQELKAQTPKKLRSPK